MRVTPKIKTHPKMKTNKKWKKIKHQDKLKIRTNFICPSPQNKIFSPTQNRFLPFRPIPDNSQVASRHFSDPFQPPFQALFKYPKILTPFSHFPDTFQTDSRYFSNPFFTASRYVPEKIQTTSRHLPCAFQILTDTSKHLPDSGHI